MNNALSKKLYGEMPGAFVEWVVCPEYLEAVTAMLSAGLVDVAVMFSEDAAAQVAASRLLRVCGTFNTVARRWCVLVRRHGAIRRIADLQFVPKLGVPPGFGSKLMLSILGDRLGWSPGQLPQWIEQDSLSEAMSGILSGQIQALLWENSGLIGSTSVEACEALIEVTMPWPSHVFIASRETLRAKTGAVKQLINYTNRICAEFKENKKDTTVKYLQERYNMSAEEAAEWVTSAAWTCQSEVDPATLAGPLEHLQRLEMVPPDCECDPVRCLAPCSRQPGMVPLDAMLPNLEGGDGGMGSQDSGDGGNEDLMPVPAG
jgi:ABC-type nitrate/sulfonate/bicarbonate transport system substrate-binding protein